MPVCIMYGVCIVYDVTCICTMTFCTVYDVSRWNKAELPIRKAGIKCVFHWTVATINLEKQKQTPLHEAEQLSKLTTEGPVRRGNNFGHAKIGNSLNRVNHIPILWARHALHLKSRSAWTENNLTSENVACLYLLKCCLHLLKRCLYLWKCCLYLLKRR